LVSIWSRSNTVGITPHTVLRDEGIVDSDTDASFLTSTVGRALDSWPTATDVSPGPALPISSDELEAQLGRTSTPPASQIQDLAPVGPARELAAKSLMMAS
jgi:hypothetical protein